VKVENDCPLCLIKKCHYIASSHRWVQRSGNNGHRQRNKQDLSAAALKKEIILTVSIYQKNIFPIPN
jgi:hypothetical protein